MQSLGYRLLDFGNARKLEQFGSVLLDRPCPAAEGFARLSPRLWQDAVAASPDEANFNIPLPDAWRVAFLLDEADASSQLEFQLKVTPFGHVGVFPEQLPQWRWLYHRASQRSRLDQVSPPSPPGKNSGNISALNLFAYTGGSTLALARGGAAVVHVDASAPAVAWARSNAHINKLSEHPIRWIVEDALKFVHREIRRGNHYDFVVLDPPAYGHGPSGKAWDLSIQWQELLLGCLKLLEESPQAQLLWTGHSESPTPEQLAETLRRNGSWQIDSGRSRLSDTTGRTLDAGYFVRATSLGQDRSRAG